MVSKLKNLSGKEVLKIFSHLGFNIVSQKGSHIKISSNKNDAKEILVIPNHKEISKGTLKSIINQATRFISKDDLEEHFYNL